MKNKFISSSSKDDHVISKTLYICFIFEWAEGRIDDAVTEINKRSYETLSSI